jgi:hypothetical protein
MYKALIKPIQPVLNNKSICKMKILLKIKIFLHGIFIVVLFLLNTTLQNITGMGVRNVFFCHTDETIKHFFF